MNWEEAKTAMQAGAKVRYSSWWWGRYIYIDSGKILHEDGRWTGVDPGFAGGKLKWEIYNEAFHGEHKEKAAAD